MTTLTHEDIESALGSVEDHYAAQILETGATLDELAQAQAWLVDDDAMISAGQPMPAGRVGQLVDIMRRAEESRLSDPAEG
jgi:hypothetical protein